MPDTPSRSDYGLGGRSIVITGAGSGLGRQVARACADAGMRLTLTDIDRAGLSATCDLISGTGVPCGTVFADVSDEGAVARIFATAISAYGKVEHFVHCAAIGGRHSAVDYPMELWDNVMRVNATGGFLCAVEAGRQIAATAGQGSMVLTSSIVGLVGFTGSVGYQVSKAMDVQLTKSLAVELAGQGIRVNSIAPGYFETPATTGEAALEPAYYQALVDLIPMARPGKPPEATGAILFLLSDDASHITGQILAIDGGMTARRFRL